VPRLCEFYPGICLTTEEKARKNLSQGKKNLSQVKKNLSHSTVYVLPKTPTHYKALINTHITKPTHTHTTKQYETTTVIFIDTFPDFIQMPASRKINTLAFN
jgi:hypothetical protein